MVDEDELRQQMIEAFADADYPVESPMSLLPALPDGTSTSFESGDFSMSVIEMNMKLDADFPYESPEAMADHIIAELRSKELI
ncbi:MAG: MTH865 family protein [Salinirussus sp.]